MTCHRREKTQRLLDRATRLQTLGDMAAALKLTRQAVRLEPSHERARLLHAELLLAFGEAHEAIRTLNAADWYDQSADTLSIRPADLAARLIVRAAALHAVDQPDRATRVLTEAVELDPSNRRAVCRLAALLIEQGHPRRAIEYLDCIHDAHDSRPVVLRLLAEACEAASDARRALDCYEQLLDRDDIDPALDRIALSLRRARLLRRVGRFADAAEAYQQLLAHHENDIDLRLEIADLALQIADDRGAVEHLNFVLQHEPEHAIAAVVLAEQHMRCGRFHGAARLWHRLIQRDENTLYARACLIVCAYCDDRTRLAERLLDEYRRAADPIQQQAALARAWRLAVPAQLMHRSRDNERADVLGSLLSEAAQVLDTAIAEQPDFADLHYHRAVCAAADHDAQTESESLDRALSINAGYLDAVRRRVDALLCEHQPDRAAAVLAAARHAKPHANDLLDMQASLDILAGRVEAAVERLSDAQLDPIGLHRVVGRIIESASRYGIDPNHIHRFRTHCDKHLGLNLATPISVAA